MIWERTTLGSVCEFITKGTTPKSYGMNYTTSGVPFVRVNDFPNGKLQLTDKTLFVAPSTHQKFSRSTINVGDVLLSIAGTIGRSCVVPDGLPEMNCNQAVCVIRVDTEFLDANYLNYWLSSIDAKIQMSNGQVTGVISNFNLTLARLLTVPLPPLPEQKRIGEILDRAEALRSQRRAALALLDELTQSIFLDMFGDPVTNPKRWPAVPVGEATSCIVPGRDKPKSFTGDTPWVTTEDLVRLGSVRCSKKQLGLTDSEIKRVRARVIPDRSVLMSCAGQLGILAIAERPMVVNQQLHTYQCGKSLNPLFLMHCLSFRQWFMHSKASSTTLSYMNKTVCNSIPITIPPIDLQNEFEKRVTQVRSIGMIGSKAGLELDAFFTSLQHRAFRGEL